MCLSPSTLGSLSTVGFLTSPNSAGSGEGQVSVGLTQQQLDESVKVNSMGSNVKGNTMRVRDGYFICETSKICISKQLLCDGHANCGFDTFGNLDTSDEKCKKIIWIFSAHTYRKVKSFTQLWGFSNVKLNQVLNYQNYTQWFLSSNVWTTVWMTYKIAIISLNVFFARNFFESFVKKKQFSIVWKNSRSWMAVVFNAKYVCKFSHKSRLFASIFH